MLNRIKGMNQIFILALPIIILFIMTLLLGCEGAKQSQQDQSRQNPDPQNQSQQNPTPQGQNTGEVASNPALEGWGNKIVRIRAEESPEKGR